MVDFFKIEDEYFKGASFVEVITALDNLLMRIALTNLILGPVPWQNNAFFLLLV